MRKGTMLAAALAMVAGGCGGGGDGPGADTLTIHASTNPFNAEVVRAAQLALQDAGGRAGRFKIRLVVHNEASPKSEISDPDRVRRNAREAADDPRAIAYMGDATSPSSVVSAPILNRAGLLQVSASAGYTGLTRSEGAAPGEPEKFRPSGRRTFARVVPADHLEARAAVVYARELGIKRLGLVADKTLKGQSFLKLVRSAVRDFDMPAVDTGPRGSVTEQVRRVLAGGADGVYFATCSAPGELFDIMREHRDLRAVAGGCSGFPPGYVGPSTLAGRFFVVFPGRIDRTPAGRRWAQRWKERASDPVVAAMGYETMSAVLAAIERAGDRGDDRAAVVKEFFATHNRNSILGRYSIDRNGDTTLSTFSGYKVVKSGKQVFDRDLELPDLDE